jgi:hypothetical protein
MSPRRIVEPVAAAPGAVVAVEPPGAGVVAEAPPDAVVLDVDLEDELQPVRNAAATNTAAITPLSLRR